MAMGRNSGEENGPLGPISYGESIGSREGSRYAACAVAQFVEQRGAGRQRAWHAEEMNGPIRYGIHFRQLRPATDVVNLGSAELFGQ